MTPDALIAAQVRPVRVHPELPLAVSPDFEISEKLVDEVAGVTCAAPMGEILVAAALVSYGYDGESPPKASGVMGAGGPLPTTPGALASDCPL